MEEYQNHHQWPDPLLLTDVSLQQQHVSHPYVNHLSTSSPRSYSLTMADSVFHHDPDDDKSVLGFSTTSPDLVICDGSPEVPKSGYGDSPEFLERNKCSTEVSLENGIKGSDEKNNHKTLSVRFSSLNTELSPESSLELFPPPTMQEEGQIPGVSINADCGESMLLEAMEISQVEECNSSKDGDDCEVEEDSERLKLNYDCQKKELAEARKALEELKRENELKNKECQEAWKSLEDLQNELMRKSMHVGSLAFAIEGQVKEKSRWFLSLRDLTRRLKIMKMEQIKLFEEASAYKKCITDMNEVSSTVQSKINHQVDLYEHLKIQFIEGTKERKELYNKVLELKGNIRVFCRCRPLNSEEIAAGSMMAIDFESARDGNLTVISNGAPKKAFKFDAVFRPQADQDHVFQDTAPFAASVLDGYNVCIFAYGQTGTGKTFTMEGTQEARGVNFRTLEELFRIIKEREKLYRYDISVSVLEVYNEQIRDLLAVGSQPGAISKRLEIRQSGEGMHHVPGLVEACVNNVSEVWEVLQTGSKARAVGSTNANEHSSRSHCIHCVMVRGENLLNGEYTKSKLWLVDLAGSERVAKTEVQGERLKETQNINRSLSALGDVISALATKSPHIPFRNSKLTHLLQDSLGGDSKTLMFVQISPNENDLSETLCSLNFASRVRGIELGAAKKQLDTSELLRYKQMFEKAKQELKSKDVQSRKMEDTIHGLYLKINDKDLKIKSLQDKVRELESQLLVERKLARQHVDTKIAEQHLKQQQQEEQSTAPLRPLLANRLPGSNKSLNELANTTVIKEQGNPGQPLTENNSYKPSILLPQTDGLVKYINPLEKENNHQMAEQIRLRPPLANRLAGGNKNLNELANTTVIKEQANTTRPPTENNSYKPSILLPQTDDLLKHINPMDKENNPEMAEQIRLPKQTGRASICAAARRIPVTSAPRRNSLIPLPSAHTLALLTPALLPLPPCKTEEKEESDECLPEQVIHCTSPKVLKSGSKKLSNILRRSLQKKMQMKCPKQQHFRRGGVNVGMEKVRVSIGSRGRMAHRVLLGSGRRGGTKEIQQKQMQKGKERGWNIGTVGRNI